MPEEQARASSGIAGLDGVLHGGFPAGRNTLILGGPGSGKTVLAMEFLANGARLYNEPGIMVSFEESPDSIVANCGAFGWDLKAIAGSSLVIIDGRMPVEIVRAGDFDLSGLIAVVGDRIAKLGAKRLVLDGLDAVFGVASSGVRQRELQRLFQWLEPLPVTTLMTIRPGVDEGNGTVRAFEQAEYASDAVIRLSYKLNDRLLQRLLRVIKIRGANFAAGEHPVLISDRGVSIAYTDLLKQIPAVSTRRISTGIPRLDTMLAGGFREGSIALISGLPGTSKTTIAASFLGATLARGERALLIAFDEPAEQMLTDLQSVNIHLAPYRDSGLLRIASYNAGSVIGDEHLLAIEQLVDEHRPTAVMIDPITALQKSGGQEVADLVSDRLANTLKSRGITAVFTAVGESRLGDLESTSAKISTVADTWIHVSYAVLGGERNRTITVVKSRGTGHSNQMRELILSDDGITLKDVYYARGDVLLGTARLEREQIDRAERSERETQAMLNIQLIEAQRAAALARSLEAQREVDELTQRVDLLVKAASIVDVATSDDREAIFNMRTTGHDLSNESAKTSSA